MIIELVAALLLLFGTPTTGWASHYDEYVMDWQLQYHGLEAPCDGCAIAVADCSQIGRYWMIRPVGSVEWIPVIVADCAGNDGTPEWMAENNIILELSHELAEQFDAVGRGIEVEVMR